MVTEADYGPFQSAGINREAVIQGILIVVGFNLINRMADAFHFETPSAPDFLPSARFLRRYGYRHLAGPRLPLPSTPWMHVAVSPHSKRGKTNIAALVDSTDRWLRFLVRLGSQPGPIALDTKSRVWQKVLYDPATITPDDLAALERRGCTQADVFNLVLGAASAAALLRLDAGLRAMSACGLARGSGYMSRQVFASCNESTGG